MPRWQGLRIHPQRVSNGRRAMRRPDLASHGLWPGSTISSAFIQWLKNPTLIQWMRNWRELNPLCAGPEHLKLWSGPRQHERTSGRLFLECGGRPSCGQRSLQSHPKAAGARQLQALDPVKGLLPSLVWLHVLRFVLCPQPADIHQQVGPALTQDRPTSP